MLKTRLQQQQNAKLDTIVSNAVFPTTTLETLCWKRTVSTANDVETGCFQHSVSNTGVGNAALETVIFQFGCA